MRRNFEKNKVVTGKTPFFVIGQFCGHHFICLKIGFWYGTFVWKWCVCNFSSLNLETALQVFEKGLSFITVEYVVQIIYFTNKLIQSNVYVYVNLPDNTEIKFWRGETFFIKNNLRKGYEGVFLWRNCQGGFSAGEFYILTYSL